MPLRDCRVKKVLGWTLNILDALQYIHGEGFVHRDLNLDNILVSCILFHDPLLLSVFLSISHKSLGNGLIF